MFVTLGSHEMYSLIIPIYKNEECITDLIETCHWIKAQVGKPIEFVFVIDGSPDKSHYLLEEQLRSKNLIYRLVVLSKNFGSFAAIRSGLQVANGQFYAVMAADLQEPKDLVCQFFKTLEADECDVVVGTREHRSDPWLTKMSSNLFWQCYRFLVHREMPIGGVDVFGCNRLFRDQLILLKESNSSLVGLIYWLGFRRKTLNYDRQKRGHGKSAWTLRKKVNYMLDSLFSFTDLPIRILIMIGFMGVVLSCGLGLVIFISKIFGQIPVPGYTTTAILIVLFASLNSLGLGIVGMYVWRAFENTKSRPEFLIMKNQRGD